MEHYRNKKQITFTEMQAARGAGVNLLEFIDRQGRKELLECLVDAMEYGTPYCVVMEKSVAENGFTETVTFDLRFRKMEE